MANWEIGSESYLPIFTVPREGNENSTTIISGAPLLPLICGEKQPQNAGRKSAPDWDLVKEKEKHSASLKLRSVSLAKLLASKLGFAGKVGTVRFHPKVDYKLSLFVGTKSKI